MERNPWELQTIYQMHISLMLRWYGSGLMILYKCQPWVCSIWPNGKKQIWPSCKSLNIMLWFLADYTKKKDMALWLCINKEEYPSYLQRDQIAIGNVHFAHTIMLHCIARIGVYWPTIYKGIHEFISGCPCQMGIYSIELNHITLYKTQPMAPKWAKELVEYLTTNVIPKKMSKVRQRYLQKYAQDCCIIANKLYHRGTFCGMLSLQ